MAWGRFELKSGGWVEYTDTEFDQHVWARFAQGVSGRLELVELHMGRGGVITGEVLRRVNPGRLEAAANSPDMASEIRQRIADDREARSAGGRFYTAIQAVDDPVISVREDGEAAWLDAIAVELRSTGPSTPAKRPDAFYRTVAIAFARLSSITDQPAGALADALDVPVTTIHRWVKEARRRGLLAPARHKGHA